MGMSLHLFQHGIDAFGQCLSSIFETQFHSSHVELHLFVSFIVLSVRDKNKNIPLGRPGITRVIYIATLRQF